MFNNYEIFQILFEIVFYLPHVPPWIEFTYYGKKYLTFIQPFLITWMSLKFFHLLKQIELRSPLNNPASLMIMAFSGVTTNTRIIMIKAWITMNPAKTLGFGFVIFIFLISYSVMIAERINVYANFYGFHQIGNCYEND